jgi:universal stress protein E
VQLLRQSPAKVLLVDAAHAAPFQTVVACVDFAASACEVVAQAKSLAALGASRMEFLHLYDPPWHRLRHVMPALSASPDLRDQYLNMLECQLKDLVGDLSGLTARRVLHESPLHRSGIAAFAQQQNANLIVLATGRRSHVEGGTLGSTAERLVRELPCSVLVVKPSSDCPGVTAATDEPAKAQAT